MMRRMRNALFAAFCMLCLLALVWPGYALVGNRIDPMLLGLPFSFFWNILWIVLSFVALWTYDLTDPVR